MRKSSHLKSGVGKIFQAEVTAYAERDLKVGKGRALCDQDVKARGEERERGEVMRQEREAGPYRPK